MLQRVEKTHCGERRTQRGASALRRYELVSCDTVISRNFQAAVPGDARRFIEEEMTLPAGAEYLTVRVVDASTNTRSYTLKVTPQR